MTKTKHQNDTKSHTLLFISHYYLIRYESSSGHKIEEVTPKQIGDEHGRKKQNRIRQTNREESTQKEAGVEVACKAHHHQGGIQEGKTEKQKRNKAGQPYIIRVGQERQQYRKTKQGHG